MSLAGDKIKERRTKLGWTQDQLAQRAGISKGFLSDLENGKRSVGADNLLCIAKALSVSLDHLMVGEPVKPASQEEVQIPKALADFAAIEGLSFRQVYTLLDMQRQIVAHRSQTKDQDPNQMDWRRFYEAVKEFM